MAAASGHSHGHSHGHGSSFALDEFAFLQSPVHRWEKRLKMAGLLLLIVSFAIVDKLVLLPALVVIALLFFVSARLPFSYLWKRAQLPGLFIAALVLMLPFVSGSTALASLGPLTIYSEGVASAVLVTARFFSIFTLALVLFASESFLDSIKALRGLRVPDILADMVLLTYRYLFEIGDYFNTMRRAARLRGFSGSKLSFSSVSTLASLLGHLFVRSFEQSEQVYRAMVLRGYGAAPVRKDAFQPSRNDYLKFAGVVVLAFGLMLLQWLLPTPVLF